MKFWVNTISKDHVARGIEGGFTQANHGKPHTLKRLSKGDWIIFYSPKTSYQNGEPLQAFTAVGQVKDEELYKIEMAPGFEPWRRNIVFYSCHEVLINPLIDSLSFIKDKTHWGYKFRFGLFEISKEDFEFIYNIMRLS
jgi:hypothetical protein